MPTGSWNNGTGSDTEQGCHNRKKEKAEKPEKAKADINKKPKKDSKAKSKKSSKAKDNAKSSKSAKAKKTKAAADKTEHETEQAPVSSKRLITVLTVICAAVALLLATVNHFTEAKIAENNAKAMLVSIREIFDESVEAEAVVYEENPDFTSVYLVMQDDGVCGYAASVAPSGFGGAINLMVGVDSAGTVMGVEIVSMSETPGLGSRVGNDDFLSLFKGKSGQVSVDVISGASISSKAVIEGVNSVSANLIDLDTLAAKYGFLVVPYVRDEAASTPVTEEITTEVPATEAPATDAPETEAPVTVAPVTEQAPPDVSKGETPPQNIVDNPNDVNEGIYAEYEEDTAEYETLTTEPETTEPEETEKA
ncbi:MAG: RnfABCDGE type electron transport complex subunit G [Clostridia bacterium]|nr:RnfABCDGE type electron transport complex subunit G [Clostridia bacterium]